ncbi:radical SAM protein [bacterium]|nr:radical SAM protein [bacterium]
MLRISEYIRHSLQGHPARPFPGLILIWNLTRSCNLACQHCYASAGKADPEELSTAQALDLVPQLRSLGVRYAILSGGEPLARRDLFELSQALRAQGIATSLSSNGLLITRRNLPRIAESFDYVGISIDGRQEVHDQFRGQSGAWARSLAALRMCHEAGLKVGVRFTLSAVTASSLPDVIALTRQEDFPKLYISHLVYSGRGGSLAGVTPEQQRQATTLLVESALDWQAAGEGPDVVTGNNEADAVLLLERFQARYPDQAEDLRQRLRVWGGNQAGTRMLNVDPRGNVKPDPFFVDSAGNLKERTLADIWSQSELLQQLRQRPSTLKGPCSQCQYLDICNGNSRARSYALSGDYFQSDPSCFLSACTV